MPAKTKANRWLEIPVCLPGVTPEPDPGSHAPWFDALLDGVNARLAAAGKSPFAAERILVEWGWEGSLGRDRDLAAAERMIGDSFFRERRAQLYPRSPIKKLYGDIRRYFLYGLADMFYYVSEDGQQAVRENVFSNITRELGEIENRVGAGVHLSLTFFAHSAGSVIAHDFLYRLFDPRSGFFGFGLNEVRKMARHGRLRVRRVYTMGSPIAPLIVRHRIFLKAVISGEKLDPERLGLRAADRVAGARWLNFWDYDDIFSFPMAFLYASAAGSPVVRDVELELGGFFPAVHDKYAASPNVADMIAESF